MKRHAYTVGSTIAADMGLQSWHGALMPACAFLLLATASDACGLPDNFVCQSSTHTRFIQTNQDGHSLNVIDALVGQLQLTWCMTVAYR